MNKLPNMQAQVAAYYERAFEASQASQTLRTLQDSRFANTIGFLAKQQMGEAYELLAAKYQEVVDQQHKGHGDLITVLKIVLGKYREAQEFAAHIA